MFNQAKFKIKQIRCFDALKLLKADISTDLARLSNEAKARIQKSILYDDQRMIKLLEEFVLKKDKASFIEKALLLLEKKEDLVSPA